MSSGSSIKNKSIQFQSKFLYKNENLVLKILKKSVFYSSTLRLFKEYW